MKLLTFLLIFLLPIFIQAQTNWTIQTTGTIQNLNSIQFTDGNTGFAVGNAAVILKTTNGGTNWTSITTGRNYNYISVSVPSSNVIYIGTDSNKVLKSIDGGDTWSLIQNVSLSTAFKISSMSFFTSDYGFLCGNLNEFWGTTNGGSSWPLGASIGAGANNSYKVFLLNGTKGWLLQNYFYGSIQNEVMSTNDGGNNWSRVAIIPAGQYLNSIHYNTTIITTTDNASE